MSERTELGFEITNPDGKKIKVHVEGDSNMAHWKDDLKFEVVLGLLDTIYRKNFLLAGNVEEFYKYVDEVQKTLDAVRDD